MIYIVPWNGTTEASTISSGANGAAANHLTHTVGAPLYADGVLGAYGASGLVSLATSPNPAGGENALAYAVAGDAIGVLSQSGDGSTPSVRLQVFVPEPPNFSLVGHSSTVRFS